MNDFKDIKSSWSQRNLPTMPKNGSNVIIKNSQQLKKAQLMGQLVLSLTVGVLLCFFFYVSGFKNATFTWGISLMVCSLLLRIGVEIFSKAKLKKLNPTLEVAVFNQKMMSYYNSRLSIHYLLTPICFLSYIIGFIIILPVFKANLSPGFYSYIVVSAILSFICLTVLIAFQVKKELKLIQEMRKETLSD